MRRDVLIACCWPPVLLAVDFAILSVAAPDLRAALDMTAGDVRWLFSAFSLAFGCLLLAAGRAADGFGRRRLLLVGLVVFGAGTGLTATAASAASAIAGRALEGAGAATMSPAALSILTATTREGEERSRVLAAYGVAISTGFVAGTVLSGVLATVAGWRAAIGATLPLVAVALAAAWRLPDDRRATATGGTAGPPTLVVAGLVGAAALGAAGGSWLGLGLTAIAAAALLALAARLGRGAAGRGRPLATACAAGLVVTGTAAAGTLLLTLHLQDVRGYSPLEAGLVFACFGATAIPGAAAARRLTAGHGVALGLGAQGVALVLTVPAMTSAAAVVVTVCVLGFGHVVGNASVAALATTGAVETRHGALAGMLVTAQYLGGALGPPLLGRAGFEPGMALAGAVALVAATATWRGRAAA